MTSIAITALMQRTCSSHHVTKKHLQLNPVCSLTTKQATHVVTLNTEDQKSFNAAEKQGKSGLKIDESKAAAGEVKSTGMDTETPIVQKFTDERWKKGTWDLNMFVKDGKMDWDTVIVSEARRRKFLELYPESATNEEPVVFRSSM